MLKVKGINIYKSARILSLQHARKLVIKLKSKNKKVGLCHGGFDLLHPGHIKHFESAKRLCDILFVSVTSDKFVSVRKGFSRPIFSDKLRAYMIASVRFVDYVVISNFKTGIEIIKILKPDYYIKGPDYMESKDNDLIDEKKAIASFGGKIRYTKDQKLSTTDLISYVKDKI